MLRCPRKMKGELHEAFNMGLDPSLDPASHADQARTEGELKHSKNLWPEEADWSQAGAFVSEAITSITSPLRDTEEGKPRLLV
jgi:hypothetical protein